MFSHGGDFGPLMMEVVMNAFFKWMLLCFRFRHVVTQTLNLSFTGGEGGWYGSVLRISFAFTVHLVKVEGDPVGLESIVFLRKSGNYLVVILHCCLTTTC